ncbi:MAG: hypothetical protein KBD83_02640 [Gammaproteobacteria bacterium]|nr:hypothetical protein [Gammaproteobacteria bacterium]
MKYLIKTVFFFFLFTTAAYATVTQQSGKILIEKVSSPELYAFCNQKNSTIVLDRVDFENPGVQAGWSSSVPAHMCSVFLANTSPYTFACSEEAAGVLNEVDCKTVLLTGRFPWGGQAKSKEIDAVSYWIAEAVTSDEIPIALRQRGLDL